MLTPIDIRNRQLKPKMGGYDKKDTDDFIEEIIASYEEMYNENRTLKEKITSLSEGIQYYKKMEGTLQKALVLAEKTSSETQEAAKSQADSMMTEASAKAEALSRETKAEIDALRAEAQAQAEVTRAKANRELEETRNHVRKLVQSYENYRLQFKKLAEAQIEMLDSESFSIFVPELDELMNEAPSADNVMDNPGIIPINIGSPAPFVELPDDTPAESPKIEEVPVSVSITTESSIAIPITSSIEPFTAPPADEETDNATTETTTIDIPINTSPTIDINIHSSMEKEPEKNESFTVDLGSGSINIPISTESFVSPEQDIEIAASPSMEVPIETPAIEIPISSKIGEDTVAPVLDMPVMSNDVSVSPVADTPSADIPLIVPPIETPVVDIPVAETPSMEVPIMDLSMVETPAMETPVTEQSQVSTNGLIGLEPENTMADMSPFMKPEADLPQNIQAEAAASLEQQSSTNGIISDAFVDPFESSVKEMPAEPVPEQPKAATDSFMDINPFNFIDPES